MDTTKQVLHLLNSNNLETTALKHYEKFHLFSIGVEGYDDISVNLLYIQNDDDDIITFCSPALYEYNENDFSAVIAAINEMSVAYPFVRVIMMEECSLWLYYDHKLFGQEVTMEMLQHIISSLVSFGLYLLNKIDEHKLNPN